jgi:hypothetical protein
MNVKDKYFKLQGKAVNIQCQISEYYREIQKLNKKQQKLNEQASVYEDEVRQMFNDGVFDNYSHETRKWMAKLRNKKNI